MNFLEAVAEIERLPNIDATTSPYFLTLSRSGVPTSAFVTLTPRANGTWSASIGDLRDSSEVARDDSGLTILFPDEDAACRWAVAKVRSGRSAAPADAQEIAQAVIDGQEMERRFRELEEAGATLGDNEDES